MSIWKSLSSHAAVATLVSGLALGAAASYLVTRPPRIEPLRIGPPPAYATPIAGVATNGLDALRQLDQTFADLVTHLEPSVVHIRTESKASPDGMFDFGGVSGVGSGVVYRSDGWIVTNDHVVNGFDKVTVVLSDGREFPGKVVRTGDRTLDIALVKIDAKDLKAARFGDSRSVRPGQFAIAIGSPFGLENSVTIGHISALARTSQVGDPRLGDYRVYSDLIQTDAPLNQGNSGGPLLNINGEVIGINSAIYSRTGANAGVGFAIPSNIVRLVADTLIEKGKIVRGYLGLVPENLKPYQLKEKGISGGAVVAELPPDGPAAKAGLRKDDVILRIESMAIANQQDVRNAMLRYGPGSKVQIEALRGSQRVTVTATLGSVPQEQVAMSAPNASGQTPRLPRVFERLPEDLLKPFGNPFGDEGPNAEAPGPDVPPLRTGQAELGVSLVDPSAEVRARYGIPDKVQGAVVTDVKPGSVAARIGIKPGSVIQSFDGKPIRNAEDLAQAMKGVKWGDTKQIRFSRYSRSGVTMMELPAVFR
ncbi:MAG: trypsin-like peptidase domain-containing protein [Armatimonadetes bacterium]|nr:trypsin-like peptidase domain-containing protein [Armatimonadota bacterium]